MLKEVEKFFTEKQINNMDACNIIYLTQVGSYANGTNDENSDLDFRAVVIPNVDEVLGVQKFEHAKLISGKNGINQLDDLDIEIFSFDHFIDRLVSGDITSNETLWTNNQFVCKKDELMDDILNNRDIFISKNLTCKYMGYAKGLANKAFIPIESVKKDAKNPDRIERVVKYGYDSKYVMNAIKSLRICIELLETGELILYRKDREELLGIKNGSLGLFGEGIENAKKIINELEKEKESLLQNSKVIPRKVDYRKVNEIKKSLFIRILKERFKI